MGFCLIATLSFGGFQDCGHVIDLVCPVCPLKCYFVATFSSVHTASTAALLFWSSTITPHMTEQSDQKWTLQDQRQLIPLPPGASGAHPTAITCCCPGARPMATTHPHSGSARPATAPIPVQAAYDLRLKPIPTQAALFLRPPPIPFPAAHVLWPPSVPIPAEHVLWPPFVPLQAVHVLWPPLVLLQVAHIL